VRFVEFSRGNDCYAGDYVHKSACSAVGSERQV